MQNKIDVIVQLSDEDSHKYIITISPNATVNDLKAEICKVDQESKPMKIIFGGKELQNEWLINKCNIVNNSIVRRINYTKEELKKFESNEPIQSSEHSYNDRIYPGYPTNVDNLGSDNSGVEPDNNHIPEPEESSSLKPAPVPVIKPYSQISASIWGASPKPAPVPVPVNKPYSLVSASIWGGIAGAGTMFGYNMIIPMIGNTKSLQSVMLSTITKDALIGAVMGACIVGGSCCLSNYLNRSSGSDSKEIGQ